LNLYAKIRIRDHKLRVTSVSGHASGLMNDQDIDYNIMFFQPENMSLSSRKTTFNQPMMTIHLDDHDYSESWLKIPDHLIILSDESEFTTVSNRTEPARAKYHGRVYTENGKPAVDQHSWTSTVIMLWEQDQKGPILMEGINNKRHFMVYLSMDELESLKAGQSWITKTIGNHAVAAERDDPRFPVSISGLKVNLCKRWPFQAPVLVWPCIV
jgi:hypothetical protein